MDTRDGRIYEIPNETKEDFEKAKSLMDSRNLEHDDKKYLKEMKHHPTPSQRARRKVGRNDVCPCGSGKKFKKCCLFGANGTRGI